MTLHGRLGEDERVGDLRVGQAAGDQAGDVGLARCEGLEPRVGLRVRVWQVRADGVEEGAAVVRQLLLLSE